MKKSPVVKKSKPTSIVYRNAVKALAEARKQKLAGYKKADKLQSEVDRLRQAFRDKEELWEDAKYNAVEIEATFEYEQGFVDGFEKAHQEYQAQLNTPKKPTVKKPAPKKPAAKKA